MRDPADITREIEIFRALRQSMQSELGISICDELIDRRCRELCDRAVDGTTAALDAPKGFADALRRWK